MIVMARSALLFLAVPIFFLGDARTSGASGLDADHAWRLDFDRSGARVATSEEVEGWTSTLHLVSMRRGDTAAALTDGAPTSFRGGALYPRGGVSEWYATTPAGLEQGFTIDASPDGKGPVTLDVAFGGGLHVRPSPLRDRVELRDASDRVVLVYGELHATDAHGRALAVSLEPADHDDRVALHIDDTDAAYPVMVDPLLWREVARLAEPNPQSSDFFGSTVALAGDAGFVGGRVGRPDGGAVYEYTRSGGGYAPVGLLSVGVAGDGFGSAIAVGPAAVIIGAVGYPTDGGNGAAYAFSRDGGGWSSQRLVPAAPSQKQLGGTAAISGDTAIVGAWLTAPGGTAIVFHRQASGTWTEEATLQPATDALVLDDEFGAAVAIDGDTAAIAAPGINLGRGAVYVFKRSGTSWSEQQKLTVPGLTQNDVFGSAVALAGDTLYIGRPGNTVPGVVYTYTRVGTTWTATPSPLVATDTTGGDRFGSRVALDGERLGVAGSAKAYVFTKNASGAWEGLRLMPSDPGAFDGFGSAMAVSGDTVLVGAGFKLATSDAGAANYAGAAYAYRFALPEGDPCTTANACLSGFCVDGVCCDTACGAGSQQDCQACSVTTGAAKNGTCSPAAPSIMCRTAAGDCDAPESCDGVNTSCPADGTRPNGTTCAGGSCTAGKCVASANDAGLDAAVDVPDAGDGGGDDSSCGCRTAGAPADGTLALGGLLLASIVIARRSSRRRVRSNVPS
ncbi:MAG: Fibronectin type domain protein [Myxococcaceae bacterium]|nr:Fibronectin type domain protein [Myxococcaceae bacterium]